MASVNLSGNNNNYYRIEAGSAEGTWQLTLPSQNDTLATLGDVQLLGSPWKFKGKADITAPLPDNNVDGPFVAGDAWINMVEGKPNVEWVGLDPDKIIPKDALIVLADDDMWHELSSSEIDPIFQAHVAYTINYGDLDNWNMAFSWGNHKNEGYLTSQMANALGYGDYNNSIWADPATKARISNWDMAFGWGNHANQNYITEKSAIAYGYGDYNNSVWSQEETKAKIPLWDEAHSWGDHHAEKYLTEVKTLGSILDVSVPLAQTDEVLTAVRDTDGNLEWVSKPVNVIVDGELIFKGTIDATSEPPKVTPSAGHIYVNIGGAENPNDQYDLLGDWAPVTQAKYGDKLAYGDDNAWHNIGNASVGTDLTSFNAINNPTTVKGGELHYNNNTGVFTYFKTDAFTQSETLEKLSEKANTKDVYSKSEVYTQEQVDNLLEDYAPKDSVYTIEQVDELIQDLRINDVVFINKNVVDEKGFTLGNGYNGMTAGPVTILGEPVIENDSEWTVVGGATGGDVMTSIFDVKGTPMYQEFQGLKKQVHKVKDLEEEISELKGMIKQLIKGIK